MYLSLDDAVSLSPLITGSRGRGCHHSTITTHVTYLLVNPVPVLQFLKGRGAAPVVIAPLLAASVVFSAAAALPATAPHADWAALLWSVLALGAPPSKPTSRLSRVRLGWFLGAPTTTRCSGCSIASCSGVGYFHCDAFTPFSQA